MDVPSPSIAAVYSALENLLVPSPLPSPWDECSAPPGYFETILDPEQCLKRLQDQFSLGELFTAGLLLDPRSPDAPPELHPDLQVPGRKWLALRNTHGTFDFLTDHGSLSGRLPALASQDDHHVQQLLSTAECDLLAAATVEDAATLLALGLPATISAGLTQLRRESLQTFCEAFNLSPPGVDSPTLHRPAAGRNPGAQGAKHPAERLVILGWSPTHLSLAAPGQEDVRRYLDSLYQHLGIPLQDFGWWRPKDSELPRLALAVRTLGLVPLQALLLECIRFCVPLVCFAPKQPAQKPPSSSSAIEPGKRRVLNPLASEQQAAQWREQLDREVFAPLLRALEKDSCPLTKNLRLAHFAASVALHNYQQRVVATYGPANKYLDSEQTKLVAISNLQMLMDNCLKLTQEIRAAERDNSHAGNCAQGMGTKDRKSKPAPDRQSPG